MGRHNALLLVAAAALAALPLFVTLEESPEFPGADDQAGETIRHLRPDYEPWFRPLWVPPSAEIQDLLFALQAAGGAGVLGYYLGLRRGQRRARTAGSGHDAGPDAAADAAH